MKKKRKKRRIDNGQPQLRNFSNLFRCQVVIVTYVPTMLVPFFRFRSAKSERQTFLGRFLNEEWDEFCGEKLCWIVSRLRFSLNLIVLRVQWFLIWPLYFLKQIFFNLSKFFFEWWIKTELLYELIFNVMKINSHMLYCFSELKYSIHYFVHFLKYILLLKITSVLKAKL